MLIENLTAEKSIEENLLDEHINKYANLMQDYSIHGARWMGTKPHQWVADLMLFQEVIVDVKPSLIIECGTGTGATAQFFHDMYVLMALHQIYNGKMRIITIDQTPPAQEFLDSIPEEIIFIEGNTLEVYKDIEDMVACDDTVMVFLDTDHHKEHVLKEINLYSKLVTLGSYLVVEDTWIDYVGEKVKKKSMTGPYGATKEFLEGAFDFEEDLYCGRILATQHPRSFLRRTKRVEDHEFLKSIEDSRYGG